jgi:hypothetical protein
MGWATFWVIFHKRVWSPCFSVPVRQASTSTLADNFHSKRFVAGLPDLLWLQNTKNGEKYIPNEHKIYYIDDHKI